MRLRLMLLVFVMASWGECAFAQASAQRGQETWRSVCAGCHGVNPPGNVAQRGSTLAGLNNAFNSISAMSGDPVIRSLSQGDREDLVAFLRGDPITPPPPPVPVVSSFDVTDLWVTTNEGGWGLNLTHHKSGSDGVFGVLYVYGSDGRPLWFTIPDGKWATPTEVRGTVFRTAGPTPINATFAASLVRATNVGTATITFSSATAATIVYSVNGQTITKTIGRLAF